MRSLSLLVSLPVILLTLITAATAASWRSSPDKGSSLDVAQAQLQHASALSSKSVYANNKNNNKDCVSSALPDSCDALSGGHAPEQARMQLAAELAVCELKQAGLSVPGECALVQWPQGQAQLCVEALARSPQNWSSYSGYLREIVVLCDSFQRLHGLERAETIYHNATGSFEAFMSYARAQEASRRQNYDSWNDAQSSLSRAFESSEVKLAHDLATMQSILSDFGSLGVSWRQQFEHDALQTTSVLKDLAHLSTSLSAASASMSDTAAHAFDPLPALFQQVAVDAGQDMRAVTQQHALALQSLVGGLHQDVRSSVNSLDVSVTRMSTEMARVETSIARHGGRLDESFARLIDLSFTVHKLLNSSAESLQAQQQSQSESLASAEQLAEKLSDLLGRSQMPLSPWNYPVQTAASAALYLLANTQYPILSLARWGFFAVTKLALLSSPFVLVYTLRGRLVQLPPPQMCILLLAAVMIAALLLVCTRMASGTKSKQTANTQSSLPTINSQFDAPNGATKASTCCSSCGGSSAAAHSA